MTIAGPTDSAVLESSRRGIDKDGRDDRLDLDAGEDNDGLYQLLLVSRCGVFTCLFSIC